MLSYKIENGKIITKRDSYKQIYCGSDLPDTFTIPTWVDTQTYRLSENKLTIAYRYMIQPSGAIFQYTSSLSRKTISANNAKAKPFQTDYVEFASDTLAYYSVIKQAEWFLYRWEDNSPADPEYIDSSRYDISVRILDQNAIEIESRILKEKVRIIWNESSNYTTPSIYISSKPEHAEYHYNYTSAHCPKPSEPEWYLQFLQANLKPGQIK